MTKTKLSILFISAILITGAIAASVDLTQFAEATKGKGVPLLRVGSSGSVVCGDRLCSEVGAEPVRPSEPEVEAEAEEEIVVELEEEITIEEAETVEETMAMKPHGWITATGTIQSMLDPGIGLGIELMIYVLQVEKWS